MVKLLFWLSLFFIFYTYLFYPLIIWGLNKILGKKNRSIDERYCNNVIVFYNVIIRDYVTSSIRVNES